jgi:hypothetical protein
MSRELCRFDLQCLCVNNYRGEEYNKPNTCVDCEFCVLNPENVGKQRDRDDVDKVIFTEEDFIDSQNVQEASK